MKTKFVGEQALNHCLKFVLICMQTKEIRKLMRDHMQQILSEIPLMVLSVSAKELNMFQNVSSSQITAIGPD